MYNNIHNAIKDDLYLNSLYCRTFSEISNKTIIISKIYLKILILSYIFKITMRF